jgi:hypothetical protein
VVVQTTIVGMTDVTTALRVTIVTGIAMTVAMVGVPARAPLEAAMTVVEDGCVRAPRATTTAGARPLVAIMGMIVAREDTTIAAMTVVVLEVLLAVVGKTWIVVGTTAGTKSVLRALRTERPLATSVERCLAADCGSRNANDFAWLLHYKSLCWSGKIDGGPI